MFRGRKSNDWEKCPASVSYLITAKGQKNSLSLQQRCTVATSKARCCSSTHLDGSEHGATGTNCSRLTVTAVSGQRAEVSSELVLVRVRFLLVLVLVVERVL